MEDETQETDKVEPVAEVKPVENTDNRLQSETTAYIESANVAAKRIEEANEQTAKLVAEMKALAVQKALSGKSEAGVETPEVKKLSDKEYAEALERGEVNPMKEDGFT